VNSVSAAPPITPLRWRGGLELLDQTRLPHEEVWLRIGTVAELAEAIVRLAVRGAPAIGIAAAYGLVVALDEPSDGDPAATVAAAAARLLATRPTAVNLRWALEAGQRALASFVELPVGERRERLLAWARELHEDDVARNRAMAAHGAPRLAGRPRVLTHCNAGALATGGIGTALGVIAEAFRRGSVAEVWVDETRPLLQGARLTAWELGRLGIPHRLITDSMVGALMSRGLVDAVVVGADRITARGDVANKIGTYAVAVLAERHGIPFYVAAPLSTFDARLADGAAIPLEERAGGEITHLAGAPVAPTGTLAFNPAFDVTPAGLVTGLITERGVLEPPLSPAIARALAGERQ